MIVIHHDIELTIMTVCGQEALAKPGRTGAVDLAHAIRKMEYMSFNRNPKLCAPCFYQAVGNLQFDQEPSYGEELAHMLNQDNEIVDVEEIK